MHQSFMFAAFNPINVLRELKSGTYERAYFVSRGNLRLLPDCRPPVLDCALILNFVDGAPTSVPASVE